MVKLSVLLLVYYFVGVTESTNITLDNLVWKIGSSVNVTVGPEDAVYCTVRDDRFQMVSEGPGPCRIVVDRVTIFHNGQWSVVYGVAGTGVYENSTFEVQVIGDWALPVLAWEGQELTISCPAGTAIRYCYIVAPNGTVFNMDPSTSSPHYEYAGSDFEAGDCGIKFNNFQRSDGGGWTCHVGLQDAVEADEYWTFCFVYVSDWVEKPRTWLLAAIPCLLLLFISFVLVIKKNRKWSYTRAATKDDQALSRII
uniref:Ig-like domain-containing protein n=1 Tax=Heliothis virescens TaxID=7102 RepID=A0A2A4JX55_HELVI